MGDSSSVRLIWSLSRMPGSGAFGSGPCGARPVAWGFWLRVRLSWLRSWLARPHIARRPALPVWPWPRHWPSVASPAGPVLPECPFLRGLPTRPLRPSLSTGPLLLSAAAPIQWRGPSSEDCVWKHSPGFTPVQAVLAQLEKPQRLGQQLDLEKQRLELLQKPFAEGGDGVVIGMRLGGNIAKGNRVVGRLLQLPAGEHPRSRSRKTVPATSPDGRLPTRLRCKASSARGGPASIPHPR